MTHDTIWELRGQEKYPQCFKETPLFICSFFFFSWVHNKIIYILYVQNYEMFEKAFVPTIEKN